MNDDDVSVSEVIIKESSTAIIEKVVQDVSGEVTVYYRTINSYGVVTYEGESYEDAHASFVSCIESGLKTIPLGRSLRARAVINEVGEGS